MQLKLNKNYSRALAPLSGLALIMLSQGFFNTFVSIRIAAMGYSTLVNGFINAFYFAGMMTGGIYIERLIQRIGHIRAFAIFAAFNTAVVALQSLLVSLTFWIVFRFCYGFCAAGLFIAIESWLLLLSTQKTRGRLLSFYMVSLYAAQGIAQFIINLTPLDTATPYLISIILSTVSLVPVCVMRSGSPAMSEDPSVTNIFHIFKIAPFGVWGCITGGLILSSFYSLGPVFAKNSGYSILQISQIMGFTIIGGLILQWPIGHLSDIFDRVKVLIAVAFILSIICFFLFFSSSLHYYVFLTLCVLFGGFSFTLYPLSISYTCDYFSSNNLISITCALLIVYGIGSVFGPVLASLPMTLIAPSGLFLFSCVLSGVLILLGLTRLRKKVLPKEDIQGEYIPLPRTTPLAYYLDPRQEDKDDDALEEYLFQNEEED